MDYFKTVYQVLFIIEVSDLKMNRYILILKREE
jgi:hypothetical protein